MITNTMKAPDRQLDLVGAVGADDPAGRSAVPRV